MAVLMDIVWKCEKHHVLAYTIENEFRKWIAVSLILSEWNIQYLNSSRWFFSIEIYPIQMNVVLKSRYFFFSQPRPDFQTTIPYIADKAGSTKYWFNESTVWNKCLQVWNFGRSNANWTEPYVCVCGNNVKIVKIKRICKRFNFIETSFPLNSFRFNIVIEIDIDCRRHYWSLILKLVQTKPRNSQTVRMYNVRIIGFIHLFHCMFDDTLCDDDDDGSKKWFQERFLYSKYSCEFKCFRSNGQSWIQIIVSITLKVGFMYESPFLPLKFGEIYL